nr:restriction endonuclease fold toxin [Streptomyces sp. HG99]
MGLACGGAGGSQEGCPTRPDGQPGNGRPNEAVDDSKPAPDHPCNSNCGTSNTSSGPYYSCSGTGPAEICRPITGPGDSNTNAGNYLGSLLSNGDFWSGLIETIGGAFSGGAGLVLVGSGAVECGTGVLCPVGAPSMAVGAGLVAAGVPWIQSGSDKLGQAFREADGAAAGDGSANAGMGSLVKVNKPDPSADALAERLRGESRVKFENDPAGREFDAVSDTYVAQAKPANFQLGKAFRRQAQATFKMAGATGRVPYFQFDGAPGPGVVDAIRRYSQRYRLPAVIDTEPIILP